LINKISYERDEKCVRNLFEILKGIDDRRLRHKRENNIEMILKKKDGKMWTGIIWLRKVNTAVIITAT
jgi:hypothetical protein